jgi:hypothetical protein
MTWFRRKPEPSAPSSEPVPGVKDLATLTRIARTHLDADIAQRWIAMLRPAVRLVPAGDADTVVARLGGRPAVPTDFEWPVWEGAGPLSFIGEVDLEALAAEALDPGLELPAEGRLLAFYFDGSYDDFASIVGTWDRATLAGARVVHVAEPRSTCAPLAPPLGVAEFVEQPLKGRQITTHPGWEHHLLRSEFGAEEWDFQTWRAHPVQGEAFNEALFALDEGDVPRHQLGGWADPVQGPVELEVAQAAISEEVTFGSAGHAAEASAWRLLLQVDSDDASQMMWGDVGTLYWLSRDSDRDVREMGPVSFTWQCG